VPPLKFSLFLLIFVIAANPLAAEPPSLVDRLMSILRKDELPAAAASPEAPGTKKEAVAEETPPTPQQQGKTAPAKNFLPVYDLDRSAGEEETKPRLLPFFASGSLQAPPKETLSVVILIPDSDRDASKAFDLARKAQDAASGKHPGWLAKDAFLFVPQFLNPEDVPEKQDTLLRWVGGGWIYGGDSVVDPTPGVFLKPRNLNAYAVMDFVLLAISRRELFPDLERVVIAGSGAGADFVQRYAALGTAADILTADQISVRYVAANAWSYLYFDKTRWIEPKDDPVTRRAQEAVFAEPAKDSCAVSNAWPYGFESMPAYGKTQGENEIRLRYDRRNVIYLVGKEAVKDAEDSSPSACALRLQGKNISSRAQTYFSHLRKLYSEEAIARGQRFYLVPELDEVAEALWLSPCGLSSLFGDGSCAPEGEKALKILD
jgi:hypothetical protein